MPIKEKLVRKSCNATIDLVAIDIITILVFRLIRCVLISGVKP